MGFFVQRSSGGRIVLSTRPNLLSRHCIPYVPAHASNRLAEMLTDNTLFGLDINDCITTKRPEINYLCNELLNDG